MATQHICSIDGCGKKHQSRGYCKSHAYRFRTHGNPLVKKQASFEEIDVFYNEIAVAFGGDECLIWPFARNPNGYPRVYQNGGKKYAHRVICEKVHGAGPEGKPDVAHSCGNGHLGCVNPKHLRWATKRENTQDTVLHGTKSRGERHGNSKLTESDVREIRLLCETHTQKQVAALFNVGRHAITDIIAGRNWAWLG